MGEHMEDWGFPTSLIFAYGLNAVLLFWACLAVFLNTLFSGLNGSLFNSWLTETFKEDVAGPDIAWGLFRICVAIGICLVCTMICGAFCCFWAWVYRRRHKVDSVKKEKNPESGLRFGAAPISVQLLWIYSIAFILIALWNGAKTMTVTAKIMFSDGIVGPLLGVISLPFLAIVVVVVFFAVLIFCSCFSAGWVLFYQMIHYMMPWYWPAPKRTYYHQEYYQQPQHGYHRDMPTGRVYFGDEDEE